REMEPLLAIDKPRCDSERKLQRPDLSAVTKDVPQGGGKSPRRRPSTSSRGRRLSVFVREQVGNDVHVSGEFERRRSTVRVGQLEEVSCPTLGRPFNPRDAGAILSG